MNYVKIAKYISWALLIIGAVIGVLGFIVGFTANDAQIVDVLLYCAYIWVIIAVLAIVVLGIYTSASINPKGLIKGIVALVVAVVIIGGTYLLIPVMQPVAYSGLPQPDSVLKLTDTILYITYALFFAAVLAVIASSIISAVRNK